MIRNDELEKALIHAWGEFSKAWRSDDYRDGEKWDRAVNGNLIPELESMGYSSLQINWLLKQSPDNHTGFIPNPPVEFPE